MEAKVSYAAIPEAYREFRLHTFDINVYGRSEHRQMAEAAFSVIRCWLSEFSEMQQKGMGLYLCSRAKGSGKTRLAASIANELLREHSVSVKFATTLQILDAFKRTWDKSSEVKEDEVFLEFSEVDVLVVDDFGVESSENAWVKEKLYSIVNSRYAGNKITVFTSNYYLSDLQEAGYDERILDRIREKTYRIAFPEESVRRQKEKRNMEELLGKLDGFTPDADARQIEIPFLKNDESGK